MLHESQPAMIMAQSDDVQATACQAWYPEAVVNEAQVSPESEVNHISPVSTPATPFEPSEETATLSQSLV